LTYDRQRKALGQLAELDSQLVDLDAELNERQSALRSLQKLEERADGKGNDAQGALAEQSLKAAKKSIKDEIERLRRELRAATAAHRQVEDATDEVFNPHWGPLFREGYEISKFGEQVEAYACVYTSRVSNFRFYSPMQYFRGPRDRMPHER
jgi:DNA repair exonuclease SbcCD ATPase subunit